MDRKLCLIVIVAMAVMAASAPIGAQQAMATALAQLSPNSFIVLPETKPGVFSSIQGTAVNWSNAAMPNTSIRLRDARLGRVADTMMTDKNGAFEFRAVDPGSYVVEMMSPANDAVVAATPIINVTSGQEVATLLKLPCRIPPLGGLLGHSLPSALAITSAAAAAGVLAKSVVGAPASDRALPGQ
jgi:Carboxypeptidase regulatory-like domain